MFDPRATILGDAQVAWLKQTLDKSSARWNIVANQAERKPSNPIVITGDIHSNWISDLKVQWKDEKSPVVGSEFVGTSISSGDGVDERPGTPGWQGYVVITLSQTECRADYRTVPYVTRPGAPVQTHSSG